MAETIIEARDVAKKFRIRRTTVTALRNIDLIVERGEYISVMGPSGSGKTTLFNMIGALDRPSEGEVSIAGVQLSRLTSSQLAHFRCNYIGYIFQAFNLVPSMTALDNVMLPCTLKGMDHHEAVARATHLLERVGLGDRLHHRPSELSGGQQQRTAIARALSNNPLIILADEPTGNLDLQTGEHIIQILADLCKEEGVTVVTATHDHKMLATSDRVVWIADGAISRIERREDLNIRTGSISG